MATVNITPNNVTHTLPNYFYGFNVAPFYMDDVYLPTWKSLTQPLNLEIFRAHWWGIGLGSAPAPFGAGNPLVCPTSWTEAPAGSGRYEITNKAMDVCRENLLPNGGRTKLMLEGTAGTSSPRPHNTDDYYVLSNYETNVNDSFSPAGMAGWLKYFVNRYGLSEIWGHAHVNEPNNNHNDGTGGGGNWYQDDPLSFLEDERCRKWWVAHLKDYYGPAEVAHPEVPKLLLNYAGVGADSYNVNQIQEQLDGTGDSRGSNMGYFDVFDAHIYGGSGISQLRLNKQWYLPYTPNTGAESTGKSGYLAGFNKYRELLDARANSNPALDGRLKSMAMTEAFHNFSVADDNWKCGLADIGVAMISALKQKDWNLRCLIYHCLSRNTTALNASDQNAYLLALNGGNRPGNLVGTAAYYVQRQIVSPYLTKYKRQVLTTVTGSGATPASTSNNSIDRIHAISGLSADGTVLAILVMNSDLSNTEQLTINIGTTSTGPITGVRLPNGHITTPTAGASALPSITPFGVGASSFTTGVGGAPTLGIGEALFLLVPIPSASNPFGAATTSSTLNHYSLYGTYE